MAKMLSKNQMEKKTEVTTHQKKTHISKDIAQCIGNCIDDPQTFRSFAMANKIFSKACGVLQEDKKNQFKAFEIVAVGVCGENTIVEVYGYYQLPNGSDYVDKFFIMREDSWIVETNTNIHDGYDIIMAGGEWGETSRYKDAMTCAAMIDKETSRYKDAMTCAAMIDKARLL